MSGDFSRRAFQMIILAAIAIGITLLVLSQSGCSTFLGKSSLERDLSERYPFWAVYVYCQRAMSNNEGKAGQNVRDCDRVLGMAEKVSELEICKKEARQENRALCYEDIFDRFNRKR